MSPSLNNSAMTFMSEFVANTVTFQTVVYVDSYEYSRAVVYEYSGSITTSTSYQCLQRSVSKYSTVSSLATKMHTRTTDGDGMNADDNKLSSKSSPTAQHIANNATPGPANGSEQSSLASRSNYRDFTEKADESKGDEALQHDLAVGNMHADSIPAIHQPPPPAELEVLLEKLKISCDNVANAPLPLDEGEVWHLVDSGWFQKLKKYADPNNNYRTEPGKMNNSSLFDDTDTMEVAGMFKPVKKSAREGMDYTLVPEKDWQVFQRSFGLFEPDHELKRYAISIGKETTVEVYPLDFVVKFYSSSSDDKRLLISRISTFTDLDDTLRKMNDKTGEYRFWRRPEGEKMELLTASSGVKMSTQLKSIDFGDKEILVLENKSAFEWVLEKQQARHALFPDTEPKPVDTFPSSTYAGRGYQVRNSYLRDASPAPAAADSGSSPSAASSSGYNLRSSAKHVEDEIDTVNGRPKTISRQPESSGSCGLINLGNTCFMNSTLQCLLHLPDLRDYFLNNLHLYEINKNNPLGHGGRIASAFGDVMKNVWNKDVTSFSPRQFKQAIGVAYPQFYGFSQHDSQEFMTYLLDGVHEDVNRIQVKPYVEYGDSDGRGDQDLARESWYNFRLRNQSIIVDLFFGMIKSTVTCPDCNRVSVTFDPVNQLSVPLPEPRERFITFYFVDSPNTRPYKMKVAVNRDETVGDFLEVVSNNENVKAPKSRLVLAELQHSNYVRLVYRNEQKLTEVQDTEQVKYFVFALPPKSSSVIQAVETTPTKQNDDAVPETADWSYAVVYLRVAPSDDAEFCPPHQNDNDAAMPSQNVGGGADVYNKTVAGGSSGGGSGGFIPPSNADLTTAAPLVGGGQVISSTFGGGSAEHENNTGNNADTVDGAASSSNYNFALSGGEPASAANGYRPASPNVQWGNDGEIVGPANKYMPRTGFGSASNVPPPPPMYVGGNPMTTPFVIRVAVNGVRTSELYKTMQLNLKRFTDTKGKLDPWGNDAWSGLNSDSGMSDGTAERPGTQSSTNDLSSSSSNDDRQSTPAPKAAAVEEEVEQYPFYLSVLNSGTSVNSVKFKIARPKLPRKSLSTETTPVKKRNRVAAAAAVDADEASSTDAETDPIISFHIPPPDYDTLADGDADDADNQMSIASSQNADSVQYGPSTESESAAAHRRLSTVSSSGSTTGGGGYNDIIYLCVNLQKDFADTPALFNRSECGQQDMDASVSSRASGSQAGSVKLHDCLKTFLQPERLSEREMWFCKDCKDHKQANKKLDLWDLPAYLIIHLKRFNYSRWWREKLRQRVVIPEELDMSQYVMNPAHVQPVMYDFVGVSNHTGGLAAGHYWAHAKDREGQWIKLNDSFVNTSTYNDAAGRDGDETCYLVFFKLRGFQYDLRQLPVKIQVPKDELDENAKSTVNCPSNLSQRKAHLLVPTPQQGDETNNLPKNHNNNAGEAMDVDDMPSIHNSTANDNDVLLRKNVDRDASNDSHSNRSSTLVLSPSALYSTGNPTPSPTGEVLISPEAQPLNVSPASPAFSSEFGSGYDKAVGPSPDGMQVSDDENDTSAEPTSDVVASAKSTVTSVMSVDATNGSLSTTGSPSVHGKAVTGPLLHSRASPHVANGGKTASPVPGKAVPASAGITNGLTTSVTSNHHRLPSPAVDTSGGAKSTSPIKLGTQQGNTNARIDALNPTSRRW